jgi:hypothetical protein
MLALVMIFAFGIIMFALLSQTQFQTRSARRHEIRQVEFAAAEAGLNKAFAELRFFLDFGTGSIADAVTGISPPSFDDITNSGFTMSQTSAQNEIPTSGPFVGLTLYTETYQVQLNSRYSGPDAGLLERPGVTIRQDMKVRYVPLYIYGIFYDTDLEILPGPTFVQSGRVHSNGNMYVGAGSSATFNNYVTSHGEIHHDLHPFDTHHGSVDNGSVNYTNGTSAISDLIDGQYVDHDHADWASLSADTWDGHVLDSAHGMPELPLPIPDAENPHVLIEPAHPDDSISVAEIKFENKAGLIIDVDPSTFVVTAHDADGNSVSLVYDHDSNPGTPPIPVYELNTFYDNREASNVTTIDIDMGLLEDSGIAPDNGILYVNAETGVRLVNAAELPSNVHGGFTVATNGPVYVEGDYNTVDTKLSLIAADAYNQLSNNWDDANSTNWSARNAGQTTVKSVIMAGNVPTDADTPYSGGVENYFRFHEKWGGVTFTFAGSIINLWDSEVATGNWHYGNPVYEAPNRAWDWDIIYGGLAGPPGMPRVYFIDRLEWQEVESPS